MKTLKSKLGLFVALIGMSFSTTAGVDAYTSQKIQHEVRQSFNRSDLMEYNIRQANAEITFRVTSDNSIEILRIESDQDQVRCLILERLNTKKLKTVEVPGQVFALPINFNLL